MNKNLAIGFLFLLTPYFSFTQTREAVDKLHVRLASARDDTSKINARIDLCLAYRLGNTDSSLWYGQKALESAEKIKYIRGQVTVLGFMCIVMEQRGNLPKSLEMGFKALQLAEEHQLETLTGPALDGIGETYIILKDYLKAIGYLRRYIAIEANGLSDEGLAYAYFDMGVAFAGLNKLDSANYYEQRAIATFGNYNYEEPLVYQALGDIKIQQGKLQEALAYYQRSLTTSVRKNERRASAYAYNKIASFYKNTNADSAIFYAKKGLSESELINQKKTILEATALLSELYEPKDTKISMQYLKIADAYKDSIFGAGNIEAVQTLAAGEEKRQKEIEAAKSAFKNQLRQYALISGLVILLLIAFFLYRNNRSEKKAKVLLQNKNEVIEKTLNDLKSTQSQLIQSEKMASLGELTAGIAHEIQNPLNFVNNFSEVNNELIEELKSQKSKVKSEEQDDILNDIFLNNEKISHHGKRADAIVKGMLQHSRTSGVQKEPTDINALADEYLRLAYHGLRAKDKSFNAKFETDFDKSIGKINVVPQDIGRVLLNLINNAFYAVTEKKNQLDGTYEPKVVVSTKVIKPPLGGLGAVEVKVTDNGNGIPQKVLDKIFQPFFTTKPTGQGTGLGLSLSYDIVRAHGGEIRVDTREGVGSEFIIQLPFK
ncbi:MAG TPA: ATP-binding protein [Chitinophagaceae bacterium]|nr:ATP-binding protein [Chitinophagaceae bacterium]